MFTPPTRRMLANAWPGWREQKYLVKKSKPLGRCSPVPRPKLVRCASPRTWNLLQYIDALHGGSHSCGRPHYAAYGNGVPVRRSSGHGYSLLQPGNLCELGAATRRSVRVDPLNQNLPIRCPDTRGPVAPRARGCAVLLHRINSAGHRVAGHLYHDARDITLTPR